MSYRGRFQIGQEIPLGALCRDGNGTPTVPTLPPLMEIRDDAGAKIVSKKIPIMDRYGQTGLFQYNQFLDGRFSVGHYTVIFYYTAGSYLGIDTDEFDLVAGGNEEGAVISMYYFAKPHASFVVQQTSGGLLFAGRNPSI
jgi:hypothetical protein